MPMEIDSQLKEEISRMNKSDCNRLKSICNNAILLCKKKSLIKDRHDAETTIKDAESILEYLKLEWEKRGWKQ